MQWLTIEVLDGVTPAGSWERAYHDVIVEVGLTFGCVYWDWHAHRWGVVFELAFLDEAERDAFREAPAVRAALDAVPDPINGVLVYPHRAGGSGTRVPRVPKPHAGAGAAEVPLPPEQSDLVEARGVVLLSGG